MPSTINADNGVSSGSAGLKSTADSSGVLSLQTNGTTAVTVDTSQNVGIGITPNAATKFQAKIATNQVFSLYNGTFVANAVGIAAVNDGYSAYVPLDLLGSTIQFGTGGTERMRIDSSGNLGLGVTPSAWRSTTKAIQLNTGASLQGYNNGTTVATTLGSNVFFNSSDQGIYLANQAASYYAQFSGAHSWYTAASGTAGNAISFTQAMTLDASGNLLVGTTSRFSTEKFTVLGTNTTVAYFYQNTNTSGYNGIQMVLQPNGNNTSSYHFAGTTNSVNVWYLYGNGTTSYSSDARLKKNIETTRDGYLDDLMRLRVVKYNWHNDKDGTPRELGLIAQEVEEVFPNLVQEHEIPSVDGTRKNIKHSVMEFILIKAIQELKAEVDSLKSQLAAKG